MSKQELPYFKFNYQIIDTTRVDDFLLTKRTKSELLNFYNDLSNNQEKFKFWSRLNDLTYLTLKEKSDITSDICSEIFEMTKTDKISRIGWKENIAGVSWQNFVDGELHNENDLPAEVWHNGAKTWYKNGKTHRVCGPAKTFKNQEDRWFYNESQIYIFDKKPEINASGETWTVCFLDRGNPNAGDVSYHRASAKVIKRIEGKIFEVEIEGKKDVLAGNPF